ncbi:MAG: sigma-70 family RNA polymerase sigma factor, partial [Anaerorhabdus sp.]
MFNENSHEDLGKLLVKASQGDTEAFEKLYSATASAQYYLALKHTKDESLAADVVQELYIKLFKYMDKIENPRLFVAYLNRMNYTISMDLVKKYKREISTDFSESENDFVDPRSIHPKENIDQNLVSMALNELDDSLRDVVVMRYINKMKIDDIAEYLKVSKRTVSRMLSKGIEQLRKECKRLKNFSFSLGFFLTPTSPWILKSIADSAMPKELYSEVFTNA